MGLANVVMAIKLLCFCAPCGCYDHGIVPATAYWVEAEHRWVGFCEYVRYVRREECRWRYWR